jgi:hypothetical protein
MNRVKLRTSAFLLLVFATIATVQSFSSQSARAIAPTTRRSFSVQLSQTNNEDSSEMKKNDLGRYDPSEGLEPERQVNVGDPQILLKEKDRSVTSILKELASIQQLGPQKYCILGTRHCSYMHQQIVELLYVVLL